MTGLIDRLNPDVEPEPWPAEDLEKAVGPKQSCAFCDKPIEPDELWAMTLYDASNRLSGGRGLWMHLRCLNARMHHKHAVIDLKFDPDNLPDWTGSGLVDRLDHLVALQPFLAALGAEA